MTPCKKCKGTGWHTPEHQRGTVHSYICEACCKHDQGWWELTEHYSGYKENKDNACCKAGCGTMRRDLDFAP